MADADLFQVNVVDNGIAITDEEAATLFKPHVTLKSARDINAAGPGLGLYMCKCLCVQMGGNIKLLNKIKETIGKKAFVLNVKAKVLQDVRETDEILSLEQISLNSPQITAPRYSYLRTKFSRR
jgi:signal transduction histidine kinase